MVPTAPQYPSRMAVMWRIGHFWHGAVELSVGRLGMNVPDSGVYEESPGCCGGHTIAAAQRFGVVEECVVGTGVHFMAESLGKNDGPRR